MDKHTQKIRRQQPRNCLSVFDHFVGLALKGLNLHEMKLKVLFQFVCIEFLTYVFQIYLALVDFCFQSDWTRINKENK